MLKKIINALRGKRASRTEHTLHWKASDLDGTTDPLYVTDGKGPLWKKKTVRLFATADPTNSLERFAGQIAHQAKLHRKAKLVVLASAKFDLEAVGCRQSVVTDQAFLISRDFEKVLSILNLKKRPSGHFYSLQFCAVPPACVRKGSFPDRDKAHCP